MVSGYGCLCTGSVNVLAEGIREAGPWPGLPVTSANSSWAAPSRKGEAGFKHEKSCRALARCCTLIVPGCGAGVAPASFASRTLPRPCPLGPALEAA